MKLQTLLFKLEELKALAELYERTMVNFAKGSAMVATARAVGDDQDEKELIKMDIALAGLQKRADAVTRLLCEAAGEADVETAVERLTEHQARLEQINRLRSEQAMLRVTLDLELAMDAVSREQRQEAESAIQAIQQRVETLVARGTQALPGPKLITL